MAYPSDLTDKQWQTIQLFLNNGNYGNLLHVKVHPTNWQDNTLSGILFEKYLHQYPSLMGLSGNSG